MWAATVPDTGTTVISLAYRKRDKPHVTNEQITFFADVFGTGAYKMFLFLWRGNNYIYYIYHQIGHINTVILPNQ